MSDNENIHISRDKVQVNTVKYWHQIWRENVIKTDVTLQVCSAIFLMFFEERSK
jgi:hypothetical protein